MSEMNDLIERKKTAIKAKKNNISLGQWW